MSEKTITLSDEDWIVVDQALQQMPYGRVAGLYTRINAQLTEQQDQQVTVEEK